MTNNAPNLVCAEFAQFTSSWDIQHVTSALYNSQGNGKAESAVKIVNRLIMKAGMSKTDFHLSLLDWRKTPTIGMEASQFKG